METETQELETDQSSVVDLIDAIEGIVVAGRRVPFSANVVVNEDETLDLIDRARLGLPTELVQARHTLVDREQILEAAQRQAESMVARAQEDAQALIAEAEARAAKELDEHEVLILAQQRADTIVLEAEDRAEAIKSEADGYAREVMEELDVKLTKALSTVRKGLETLPKIGKKARK
jgi:F0F1-type ATP synthase membrane subunit b/b'